MGNRAGSRVRIAAVAGLLLVGCRALLDLPPVGESSTTEEEAGKPDVSTQATPPDGASNDAPIAETCTPLVPEEGIYTYASTGTPGQEGLFTLTGADKTTDEPTIFKGTVPGDGKSFPATLRKVAAGGYTLMLVYNGLHTDTLTFAATSTSRIQVSTVNESLLGQPVAATCDPAQDVLPCGTLTPATPWYGAAAGNFNGTPFNVLLAFEYVKDDAEVIAVGSTVVPTVHIHEKRDFKQNVRGHQENDYWFARDTGLLVQARIAAGTYSGTKADGVIINDALEYKGHAEIILTSLTPAPLGTPDASNDAK